MEANGKDINRIIDQNRNSLLEMRLAINKMFDDEIRNLDEMQIILAKKTNQTKPLEDEEVFEFTRKE